MADSRHVKNRKIVISP